MNDPDAIPIRFVDAARPVPTGVGSWEDEHPQTCLAPTPSGDGLELLGLSALGQLPERRPVLPREVALGPALRALVDAARQALVDVANEVDGVRSFDLASLPEDQLALLDEMLAEGEVSGTVQLDGVNWRVREGVLVGLWRVSGDDGSERLEVASVPEPIRIAASSLERAPFELPSGTVPGAMNAPAVLTEISDRAGRFEPGSASHVLNFTLLPLSEVDEQLLISVLGRAELTLHSGGFGNCRVMATRWRHVWAVQYLNAMEHTILDTVEITEMPDAVCAAREDFVASAQRLGEILEAYE